MKLSRDLMEIMDYIMDRECSIHDTFITNMI